MTNQPLLSHKDLVTHSFAPHFLGLLLSLTCLLICQGAKADIRLPKLISDGMILQRDQELTLWGWASAGEPVQLILNGQTMANGHANSHGDWQFTLSPMPAGGPHTLELMGENHVAVTDIYFGDVWLASGQSNMDTRLDRVKYAYPEEVAAAHYPLIRQFVVPREYEFTAPREDLSGGEWKPATAPSIEEFSAVAFFFAQHLHQSTGVPIGIINSARGGSTAEGWLKEEALKAFPKHYNQAKQYQDTAYLTGLIQQDKNAQNAWFSALAKQDAGTIGATPWMHLNYDKLLRSSADKNVNEIARWHDISVPGYWADHPLFKQRKKTHGNVWYKKSLVLPDGVEKDDAQIHLGTIVDADTVYINGKQIGSTGYRYPPRRYSIPAGVLRPGENTITVKVTSQHGRGGFILDKPYWLEVNSTRYPLTGTWRFAIGALTEPAPSSTFLQFKAPLGYYNAMLAPLTRTNIKGVIWYQGESNVGRAEEYTELMAALIQTWREAFNQPDLPFVLVQLANYLAPSTEPVESSWAELREAQRVIAANTHNVELAVTIDTGEWNDIHPLRKKPVGDRAALAARKLAYEEHSIISSGPKVRCIEQAEHSLVARFDIDNSPLVVKPSNATGEAKGFYMIDETGAKLALTGKVERDHIVFTLPQEANRLIHPLTLRYAWANNPANANLYNANGLPASPFEVNEACVTR